MGTCCKILTGHLINPLLTGSFDKDYVTRHFFWGKSHGLTFLLLILILVKFCNNYFLLICCFNTASCGDTRILGTNTGNKNHTFVGTLPANPGINNKCIWIIVVNTGRIELVFKAKFQVTSRAQDCKENFVQVQDGRYR